MFDSTPHSPLLQALQTQLQEFPTLMAAYEKIEPLILQAFDASRMSLFQKRAQQQDLVARFKTGKETREIKVPISPASIAGYVAMSQQQCIVCTLSSSFY